MSNQVQAIKLSFLNGLHIGRGGDELDKTATTYGSDALKSALYAVGLAYHPEWKANPEVFFSGFHISSAFPWCGEELFLPKVGSMRFQFASANDLTEAKKAKKITYISSSLFRNWAKNPEQKLEVSEAQVGDSSFLFAGKGMKFIHTIVQQRVQVATDGEGETRPFYFERLMFSENSGLYFLITCESEELNSQILHVLNLLADLGIGTDRTVGNGQFEIKSIENFEMPQGNKGQQMALGLYLPKEEEIKNIHSEESFWILVRRGGYMAASENETFRTLRKNNIYFFGEGSTFRSDKVLQGRVVDLQPSWNDVNMHPVWRDGMPLFITL